MAGLTGSPTRCLNGIGTPEREWASCRQLATLPRWEPHVGVGGRVVVVAPHPDDEVLGPGGTAAILAAAGVRVVAVAVTDGEASQPDRTEELRRLRPVESAAAATALGTVPQERHHLGLPDGDVHPDEVADALVPMLRHGDVVLGPWDQDGHPDHEAVGRGCSAACALTTTAWISYLVWTWHWARPDDVPWHRAVRVDLNDGVADRKRRAVRCFRTQLVGAPPILTPHVLARLTRSFEVLLVP